MLIPLAIPPGIYRQGTEYSSRGRWYDAFLVRWYDNALGPVGGWRKKSRSGTLTTPFAVTLGSPTVTVAHTAHGLRVGDSVRYIAQFTVGGFDLSATDWPVASIVNANSYTFTLPGNSLSNEATGGGAVTYAYSQAVSGRARGIIAWKTNDSTTWLGVGTHTGLYALTRAGQLYDITPAGFTSGRADASAVGGYGAGPYGMGLYGTPRPDGATIQDASVWTLDTWGQDLIGVMADDGKIYEWALNTSVVPTQVTNSPLCRALVVTAERFLFALGAEGVVRRVKWCDQENNTLWTAAATNQAGDFDLQTPGRLMCGKAVKGGTLLFTDLDVHFANYIGGELVYSFDRIGSACGTVSQAAVVTLDAQAAWMGQTGFWLYNGYIAPLPCDVYDYVFKDINYLQISKVFAVRDAGNFEIEWFYCSAASTEIDRSVVWNHRLNHWNIGRRARLCGADRGVFTYPIKVDVSGFIYEHEVGFTYDGVLPFAETGPLEVGNGDNVVYAKYLIPDDKTLGDVTATFKVKFEPDGAETSFGPYTLASRTSVRFCARQAKVRYTATNAVDWRVGTPRIDVTAGGSR
jgi:hypothetical protein